MTTFYKLNSDARRFFDEKYHTEVKELKWWNDQGIPINILDEMPVVYLTFGVKTSEYSVSLSEWGNGVGKFHFTVNVDKIDLKTQETVSRSMLMDEIQKVLDRHFKNRY
jgi:hypothetical protein